MYKEDDIYDFVFSTFDKDGSGEIDEEEFLDLARTVNNAEVQFAPRRCLARVHLLNALSLLLRSLCSQATSKQHWSSSIKTKTECWTRGSLERYAVLHLKLQIVLYSFPNFFVAD